MAYHCSATRLRVRGLRVLPGFFRHSFAATLAARGTPGVVRARLLGMPPFPVYFTLTVWESEKAMRDFVKTPAHREAMSHMAEYARTGRFASFSSESRRVGWRRALRELRRPAGVWPREAQAATAE
jgi:heme-degrading monooxygenase HmoA